MAKRTTSASENRINSAAILDILEKFSGYEDSSGNPVKLTIGGEWEHRGEGDCRVSNLQCPGIQQLLAREYRLELSVDTIRDTILSLQRLAAQYPAFPFIESRGRDRDTTDQILYGECDSEGNLKRITITDCYIRKDNCLAAGEYALLRAMIDSAPITPKERDSLVKKINSISSKSYSKESGVHSSRPVADLSAIHGDSIVDTISKLNRAIHLKTKVKFYQTRYESDLTPHIFGDEIIFSPYKIAAVNGYNYIFGTRDGESNLSHYRIDKICYLTQTKNGARVNNMSIQNYIDSNPSMTEDQTMVKVTFSFPKEVANRDIIGEIIDSFGHKIALGDTDEKYNITVTSTEEDALRFALERSALVEITEPTALRERLRNTAKAMWEKYLTRDDDFYMAEVNKVETAAEYALLQREFKCPDVDLSGRTEYHHLNVSRLCLERNNVSDISFVHKYPQLFSFHTSGNPIKDFSPLCRSEHIQALQIFDTEIDTLDFIGGMKNLRKLTLGGNKIADYSGLYRPLMLDYLVLYPSGKFNIDEFKRHNPNTELLMHRDVVNDKSYFIDPTYPINKSYTEKHPFPTNIFTEMPTLRFRARMSDGDYERISAEVAKSPSVVEKVTAIIDSMGSRMTRIAYAILRDGKTVKEAARDFDMRIQDVIKVFNEAKELLSGPAMVEIIRSEFAPYAEDPRPTARSTAPRRTPSDIINRRKIARRRERYK